MKQPCVLIGGLVISGITNIVFLVGCGGGMASTVNNSPPVSPIAALTVSPAVVTIQTGDVQPFSAAISPASANQAVNWSVSGPGCAGGSCGTIDAHGTYTAPLIVPSPATVTVTATSIADPGKSSFATITVEAGANNAELSGQYALLFSGSVNGTPVAVVGTFTADGNGNLVQGSLDITWFNVVYSGPLGGTYAILSDSRGIMTLGPTTLTGPDLSFTFAFAVDALSPAGLAMGGPLTESTLLGTGFFAKQDPAAFSTAGINGSYAFRLAAPEGGFENVALGRFTASGGSFSAGLIDLVGFGGDGLQASQPFAGTYSISATGRGQATLNISGRADALGVILYVVSSGESVWMDASGGGATGRALQQSGGPFHANSLNGPAVFGAAGFTAAGNDVTVGQMQFDGMGNLSVTSDENYFGAPLFNASNAGTYTVDSNGLGRGEITDNCGSSPFYLVSPGRGFFIRGCDSTQVGMFEPQTGGSFNNATFSGKYALGTLPLLYVGANDVAGFLTSDGAGNVSGTSMSPGSAAQTFTGTYSVAANGRTTLSITPSPGLPPTLVFYLASSSKAVGVQMPSSGPANAVVNVIEK